MQDVIPCQWQKTPAQVQLSGGAPVAIARLPFCLQALKKQLNALVPATWTPVAVWDEDSNVFATGPTRTNEDDAVRDAYFIAYAPTNMAELIQALEDTHVKYADLRQQLEAEAVIQGAHRARDCRHRLRCRGNVSGAGVGVRGGHAAETDSTLSERGGGVMTEEEVTAVRELIDGALDIEIASLTVGFIRAMLAERDELSQDKHALNIVVSAAIEACGNVTAERDDLRSKLAAVPVEPIRRWYENSNPQLMEYEFIADVETDAEFIEAWLGTQVTP